VDFAGRVVTSAHQARLRKGTETSNKGSEGFQRHITHKFLRVEHSTRKISNQRETEEREKNGGQVTTANELANNRQLEAGYKRATERGRKGTSIQIFRFGFYLHSIRIDHLTRVK